MALRFTHMLATSGLQGASLSAPLSAPLSYWPAAPSPLVEGAMDPSGDAGEDPIPEHPTAESPCRRRIWNLGTKLHCSIIGTCLSTVELRGILRKLGVAGAEEVSDHDLHCMAVVIAGQRAGGAKLFQKALDRRHRGDIARYSKAKEPATLLRLWDESLKQGNIPGAYWAVLTHRAHRKTSSYAYSATCTCSPTSWERLIVPTFGVCGNCSRTMWR